MSDAQVEACAGGELLRFTRELIALRKRYPVLRRNRFLTGSPSGESGARDVIWLTPANTEMTSEHWADTRALCLGLLLDGSAQATGVVRPGSDSTLLLVFNAWGDAIDFKLPEHAEPLVWKNLIDTAAPLRSKPPTFAPGSSYLVTGRSVLVFVLEAQE